jgi:hypothetical protein
LKSESGEGTWVPFPFSLGWGFYRVRGEKYGFLPQYSSRVIFLTQPGCKILPYFVSKRIEVDNPVYRFAVD